MNSNEQQAADFFGQYFDGLLKRLDGEVKLLREWFKRDFPESRLDCNVNANNITRELKINIRVLMGEQMVENRGFFENTITIPEKRIMDMTYMNKFFKAFGNGYRKSISDTVNAHYAKERSREDAKSLGEWRAKS